MAYTKYPGEIDDVGTLPITTDLVTEVRAEVVNRLRSAILALEAELDTQPSGTFGTVRARLDAMQAEINTLSSGSYVVPHSATHSDGGSDEVIAQNLSSGSAQDGYVMVTDSGGWNLALATAAVHATSHEEGGSDEIVAQDLGSGAATIGHVMVADGSGGWSLEDTIHASTHSDGGSDEITAQDLGSDTADDGYIMVADGLGGWRIELPSGGSKLISGVAGYQSTQEDNWQEIGALVIDPSEYSGATFAFEALIQTTIIAKSISIQLYNLTAGSEVSTSTQVSTSLTLELVSVALTVPSDLPSSEQIYTVRIKMGIAGGPGERGICQAAYIKVS